MADRAQKLGFVPQKELIYNKLLPYSDELDSESQKYLIDIKTNLGKAILSQDLRDVICWKEHLLRYLHLYGRKFSKEDHIHFIKAFFELLIIPDVESVFIIKIAGALISLLRKNALITREDLVIPWRPLYELNERLFNSTYENVGMFLLPNSIDQVMKTLFRECSRYFSLESTQEILDEFKPLMCPFDTEMVHAIGSLEAFLCTTIPSEHHDKGFKLWFDDLMNMWKMWPNIPTWENSLLSLMARLAEDNIGYIDWEPHLPLIFTRLLRSFNLPGRSNTMQVYRTSTAFDTSASTTLIASMLGIAPSCQSHITSIFKVLESFYHPSNHGRWLKKMQNFLKKLPAAVAKRIHRERYSKPSWRSKIPDDAKLSDDQIKEFVKSMQSAVLLNMFSKLGYYDSCIAIKNLVVLCPELIIPPIIERLYSSLETLTEPHRLSSALYCVVPVCRPLVQQNKDFTEGPKHVLPLLMASLPGIDPNDVKKSMVTFQFISILSNLILMIDCSSAVNIHPDLPPNVQEVCLSTAMFEDFVLQFMDRCFAIIENSCLDNHRRLDRDSERKSPEELYLEVGVYNAFDIIMMQSSPAIFEVALNKLHTFVTTHILEINVSGKYAANMCRVICRINPELGLKTFLPHFSKLVLALTEGEDIANEERLDDELLFSLLILNEIVRCNGKYLLQYQSQIVKVLERTIHLKCKEGYVLACQLLGNTLKSYLLIYNLNPGSVPNPWSRYNKDEMHRYLEDWGIAGNLNNLEMKMHEPSDEEVEAAKFLLEKFLLHELEKIKKCSEKKIFLTREDVLCSLNIILCSLIGAACSLPLWNEPQLNVRETSLPIYQPLALYCGFKDINFQGRNVRQLICETMHELLAYTFECNEDDTKSLFHIIKIISILIFDWGIEQEEYSARSKSFESVKNVLGNKLYGRKKHLRSLLMDRVHLTHEYRVTERYGSFFTETHTLLLKDLLKLSVSHYGQVRKRAQIVLVNCLFVFPGSNKVILDEVLQILKKDPTQFHEEFKGILHVVIGHKHSTLLTAHSWEMLSDLWPAIVSAKHSEKPSVIKLLEKISDTIQKSLTMYQIKLIIPSTCCDIAKCFWNSQPLPSSPCSTDEEISICSKNLALCSENNERIYYKLIQSLLDQVKSGNLHWRHQHLALFMLQILMRPDLPYPTKGVELFVNLLIHDTLAVRKIAISAVSCILKQIKREYLKITIDPFIQNPISPALHPLMPKPPDGKVPDNFWLMYNSMDLPNTEEKWNSRKFVHKTHLGCYSWPKPFKTCAPDSEQPKLDRTFEELNENEKPIYEAFMKKSYVDTLISYFSLEERKGQDKFDAKKYFLFKSLFTRFGDTFLPNFIDHLHRMVEDKTESVQRCCAEIICGLLHACKHFDFHKMHKMKELLSPILERAVSNLFPDVLNDWATGLATVSESRDPNRYYWIFELFVKEPQSVENGSFLESSWLFLLIGLISQQEWRAFELLHRALEYAMPKLDHSYQNVREKLGSLLGFIFMYDIPGSNMPCLQFAPQRVPFIKTLMPKLEILQLSKNDENSVFNCTDISPEKKKAENLFRTICRWIVYNGSKSINTSPPEMYQFLPLLCHVMNETSDDELKKECAMALAILGQSLLSQESIEIALETMHRIAIAKTWHSRMSTASYLQQIVFSNLYNVMKNQEWSKKVHSIVFTLLEDERVEVRESAAETISGFLHCEYFLLSDALLNEFKEKSLRKLNYKTTNGNGPRTLDSDDLRIRHAGVLGFCACVNAYPYDVPEFLPEILVLLADHLNDPQPISTTIKKTLSSFRRTHHDNWRDHKLKFTDDQLAVITDLLVSPNYYA